MPRMKLLVSALCGALLLGGCAGNAGLVPQGQLRDAGALQASRALAGSPLTPAAWPSDQWWTRFGDPQLNALVEEALAGAPSIDAADARVRKATAQAGLADAVRHPSVGGGAQIAGLQIPDTLAPDPVGGTFNLAYLLTLSLKYNPDPWGASRSKWQAAVGSAHATEVDAQAARLTLAANVARTYVALGQAFDALDATTAEVDRSNALATLARRRQQAGLDNGIGLHQNESAAAAAHQQQQAAQQQIDALRNALALLAGAGPDRGLAIQRPHLAMPEIGLPSQLPSDLLARRPDVVAARWRVEAAQHGIAASKAAFYPSINLSALVGLGAGHLGDVFGSNALLINGGPALSLPIFEGGALQQQLRGSNADYDLAVANYNQTLLAAIREVTDAVQAARTLEARIASTTQARTAANTAYTQVQARQRAGLASKLDLLAAQKPLLQLDLQLATLQAERRTAGINLDQALGGGITADAPSTTASK